MAAQINSPKTVNGVTYRRVAFVHVRAGDSIYRMDPADGGLPTLYGVVESVEADETGTKRITLTSGVRMTRRGWQNRRLWRQA